MNEHKSVQSELEEEKKKEQLKLSFKWFITSFKDQVADFISIRKGADIEGTINNIKKDTEFTGHNLWVLILSILICSIGLNMNSTAVVIGAMLISPLMGPILGMGLSLGTNNIKLLFTSLRNLLVMVLVSVGASCLYFLFTPLTEVQPEIIARTKPHLFDALIAISGGFVGIIANSRGERNNMIPGVAIATALMPPLCTVGYSLATSNYQYFLGASYLFLLNTSFIGITCFIMVRLMGFPLAKFLNRKYEFRVKLFLAVIGIAIILPSIFLLLNALNELRFKQSAEQFVKNELVFDDSRVVKQNFVYNQDSSSLIDIFILGEPLDSLDKIKLEEKKNSYGLNGTRLSIIQSSDDREEFEEKISQVSDENSTYLQQLELAKETMTFQEDRISKLKQRIDSVQNQSVIISDVCKELKLLFPDLQSVNGGNIVDRYDSLSSTLPVFIVKWNSSIKSTRKKEQNITEWLKVKMKSDSIVLSHF